MNGVLKVWALGLLTVWTVLTVLSRQKSDPGDLAYQNHIENCRPDEDTVTQIIYHGRSSEGSLL